VAVVARGARVRPVALLPVEPVLHPVAALRGWAAGLVRLAVQPPVGPRECRAQAPAA
jgi:hypothetical protein